MFWGCVLVPKHHSARNFHGAPESAIQPCEPSGGCDCTTTHKGTQWLGRKTWHLGAVVAYTVDALGLRHKGARRPAPKTGQLGAVLASALNAPVLRHTKRRQEGGKTQGGERVVVSDWVLETSPGAPMRLALQTVHATPLPACAN